MIIVPDVERITVSKGQLEWLIEVMGGSYEHEDEYRPLWDDLMKGREITDIHSLWYLCESVVDRATFGDNDDASRRDKAFGIRLMAKVRKEESNGAKVIKGE